jgi:hypothetical protein
MTFMLSLPLGNPMMDAFSCSTQKMLVAFSMFHINSLLVHIGAFDPVHIGLLLCAKHSTGAKDGATGRQGAIIFKLRHYPQIRCAVGSSTGEGPKILGDCPHIHPTPQWRMPALTRKRVNDRHITWHVHYAGVRVGAIIERSGVANTAEPWEWHCGFYSNPGEQRCGRAANFEAARTAFERASREYLPKRTEADFQAWRDQESWTERKYAMWEKGERLPSQMPRATPGVLNAMPGLRGLRLDL